MSEYPHGLTESEVLKALDAAVEMLASSFTFGMWDVDDIAQECRLFGLQALPRYEPARGSDGLPTRPLANFLYSHIRNRLINLKRDKYRRTDPPCLLCHQGRHKEHVDGEVCRKYKLWKKRNSAKANLARPLDMESVADERETNMKRCGQITETAEVREARTLIDAALPVDLRSDYLRMLAGESLPKARRERVRSSISEILCLEQEKRPAG